MSVGRGARVTTRAWRAEDDGPVGTLLSLGICELGGVIKGEKDDFKEILDAAQGPAHVIFVPDAPLVPNARLLAEQFRRTPAEREAIACDLAETLAQGPIVPTAEDWIFAGTMLRQLQKSPINDRHTILTRNGLREAGAPDAIILSLRAEEQTILCHRRLGYAFQCHDYVGRDAGPAFLAWLRANFVRLPRSVDDIRNDYRELITLLRTRAPSIQILIHNVMSSSIHDDIQTYSLFDAPLGNSIARVRDKDLNLMLHDLTRECDIAIVDADAIAANLGGLRSLIPDGVHQSGVMQAEVRAEILHILRARGVAGFS